MSDPKGILVELQDDDTNEVVETYFIRKLSIGSSARRYAIFEKIKDQGFNTTKTNNLVVCANLSAVLCDKDFNLIYPEVNEGEEEVGYLDLHDNMDETVLFALLNAYSEVNPIGKSLTAKKKKY